MRHLVKNLETYIKDTEDTKVHLYGTNFLKLGKKLIFNKFYVTITEQQRHILSKKLQDSYTYSEMTFLEISNLL